jgi:hypothetical protein
LHSEVDTHAFHNTASCFCEVSIQLMVHIFRHVLIQQLSCSILYDACVFNLKSIMESELA